MQCRSRQPCKKLVKEGGRVFRSRFSQRIETEEQIFDLPKMEKPKENENVGNGLVEWIPKEDSVKKALKHFGKKPEEIPDGKTDPEADISKPVSGIVYAETEKKDDALAEGAENQNDSGESRSDIGIRNKEEGCRREEEVKKELEDRYPESEGYKIIREALLRDENGQPVKDPEPPHRARRIDFVVVKDGKVVDSIEVTSKTAPKEEQSAKEERIRESGGNYIKDPDTGELIPIPDSVHTRIERRD